MDSQHRQLASRETRSESVELSQLALWMAGNLAGLVTAVMLARGPFFRKISAGIGRGKCHTNPPSPTDSLTLLANAIIGSGKEMIEAVFGPPRSIALEELGVLVHPQHLFRAADIWYYPLPRKGAIAMAINFHDQTATRVEFFTAPGRS
jgi:hypothetical protein